MKNLKIMVFAVCAFSLFTCEKDDLCDENTPVTPRMIFEFRDLANPESTKNVAGLRVEDPDDSSRFLEAYSGSSSELQMILPLKTDRIEVEEEGEIEYVGETKFVVYKEYVDDMTTGNADTITITYKIKDLYVSRACGYKTTYENVSVTIEPDGDNWMLFEDATNENQSVLNEDETHWTIRH
ncbi:DUF6452 family protein [Lacinutrix neustonica]|uniref:DUF6452 family protein n=1 Tax=Lacinutrix neustonica TaxID=2980107 RepID=A0A9E8MVC9_9FLAO|nr:DUF6452 family protein [Lacinutrix neustonica]WAC02287.1 DUF6452 family protein [Lacinutrix neustonica]